MCNFIQRMILYEVLIGILLGCLIALYATPNVVTYLTIQLALTMFNLFIIKSIPDGEFMVMFLTLPITMATIFTVVLYVIYKANGYY